MSLLKPEAYEFRIRYNERPKVVLSDHPWRNGDVFFYSHLVYDEFGVFPNHDRILLDRMEHEA